MCVDSVLWYLPLLALRSSLCLSSVVYLLSVARNDILSTRQFVYQSMYCVGGTGQPCHCDSRHPTSYKPPKCSLVELACWAKFHRQLGYSSDCMDAFGMENIWPGCARQIEFCFPFRTLIVKTSLRRLAQHTVFHSLSAKMCAIFGCFSIPVMLFATVCQNAPPFFRNTSLGLRYFHLLLNLVGSTLSLSLSKNYQKS